MKTDYPLIFSPLTIRGVTFRNRIIHSPMVPGMASNDGCITRELIRFHRASARGGAAIVTLGNCSLDMTNYRDEARQVDLSSPRVQIGLSEFVKGVERYGAVADIEINHPGLNAHPLRSIGAPIGPSPRKAGDIEMTQEQIHNMVDAYAQAALLCKNSGFRMVMLHGGHGNLLAQFASPLTNHRTDEYGGSAENRSRFIREVCDAIRQLCGEDFVIEYRISGSEYTPDGLELNSTLELLECLEGKIDLYHVSGGLISLPGYSRYCFPNCYMEKGINLKFAREFKRHTGAAVAVVAGMMNPKLGEQALENGDADMIAYCRPFLADPDFPIKYAVGHAKETAPCIRCGYCFCVSQDKPVVCAVNPLCGQEDEFPEGTIPPARKSKRVAIIGGGPGGMQAARTAVQRGHQVTLFEQDSQLGGNLRFAAMLPVKQDFVPYLNWAVAQTEALVSDIRLNTQATPELLMQERFDAVIAAVGAAPIVPPVATDPEMPTCTCQNLPTDLTGKRIVIIGGGMTGYETACFYKESGNSVTIVDMRSKDILPMGPGSRSTRTMSIALLERIGSGITELDEAQVLRIEADAVICRRRAQELRIGTDLVVWAVGLKPRQAEAFRVVPEFRAIGDCVQSAKIGDATRSGFDAAYAL